MTVLFSGKEVALGKKVGSPPPPPHTQSVLIIDNFSSLMFQFPLEIHDLVYFIFLFLSLAHCLLQDFKTTLRLPASISFLSKIANLKDGIHLAKGS